GHQGQQPGALLPEHRGAGEDGAAIPPVRSRPLSRAGGRWHAAMDPRRLHHLGRLSLCPAAGRRDDLHAEQRQGRDRRVQRVAEEEGNVPFMRHLVMRLPEETKAEYIYMVPFTPRGKDNLAAWMVARNDGTEYGKLRVYRLSRQRLVFGPQQIENRINQNTEI